MADPKLFALFRTRLQVDKQISDALATRGITISAANYSALEASYPAASYNGSFAWVDAAQGTAWLPGSLGGTYYPLGLYHSNGTGWVFTASPAQATQSEVDAGTNTDKFLTPSTFTSASKWATKEPSIDVGAIGQYWRGDKSWSDFASDVRAAVLTGLSTAASTVITATDTVLSALGKLQAQVTANLSTLTSHTGNTNNPHSVTKAQVGLSNVDNTSDASKPVSTATQTALDGKEPTISVAVTAPTAKYWRGDKSWQDFASDVRSAVLSGLSTATNAAISATDTVLVAIGKLQAQVTANLSTLNSHTNNTSNPHVVTKAQVGLGNTNNTSTMMWRNRLRNSNFPVNQLGLSGTVTLAAGAYGHDCFKAGAAGCTYTFATSGIDTVITITAGSLIQVVEGTFVEGGVYTLSQAGTAQARIGISGAAASGSYAATPITTGSATAGQTVSVEFTIGTVSMVQLEPGSVATAYERRPYDEELRLCRRYCWRIDDFGISGDIAVAENSRAFYPLTLPVPMYTAPTLRGTYFAISAGTIWNQTRAFGCANPALTIFLYRTSIARVTFGLPITGSNPGDVLSTNPNYGSPILEARL